MLALLLLFAADAEPMPAALEIKHDGAVLAVAFSPDGKALFAAIGDSVQRFDAKLERGKPIRAADSKGSLHHVAVSPDSKRLLASSHTTLNEGSSWSVYSRLDLATGKVEGAEQSRKQPADKRERFLSHRAQAA
ncbi:MAG: hypothetical protein K2W96_14660 [Gemmataceae bacterium]|nr:hypothetical protein [Gemmataceae bacterium]